MESSVNNIICQTKTLKYLNLYKRTEILEWLKTSKKYYVAYFLDNPFDLKAC